MCRRVQGLICGTLAKVYRYGIDKRLLLLYHITETDMSFVSAGEIILDAQRKKAVSELILPRADIATGIEPVCDCYPCWSIRARSPMFVLNFAFAQPDHRDIQLV